MFRVLSISLCLLVTLGVCIPRVGHATLVSHWRFDEGTGQAAQDSVGTNHGSLGANASVGTDDPLWNGSGKIGSNSLDFDGSNDYVFIGSPTSLDVSAVTMAAWVNLDVTKSHVVFDKSSNPSSGSGLHMRVGINTTDDTLRSFVGSVGAANFTNSTNPVPLSPNWSHVATTSNGSTLEIYINGVLEDAVTLASGIVNNTTGFRIGSSQLLTGRFLNGRVDDAGFWNNALTAPQVRALYTLGDNATLNYDLSKAQQLFDRHAAATGSTEIGNLEWVYSTGIFTGLGEVTEVDGQFFLQLSADGAGVRTFVPIPEPGTGLLLACGGVFLSLSRRKRAKK